jgi:hypothetical protein
VFMLTNHGVMRMTPKLSVTWQCDLWESGLTSVLA